MIQHYLWFVNIFFLLFAKLLPFKTENLDRFVESREAMNGFCCIPRVGRYHRYRRRKHQWARQLFACSKVKDRCKGSDKRKGFRVPRRRLILWKSRFLQIATNTLDRWKEHWARGWVRFSLRKGMKQIILKLCTRNKIKLNKADVRHWLCTGF